MYQVKFYFFGGTYTLGEFDKKEQAEEYLEIVKKTKKGAYIIKSSK